MTDKPPEWAMEIADGLWAKMPPMASRDERNEAIARALAAERQAERERCEKLFWSAKEFIDDWKKGDFSLSTLAALDAQSLDEALTTYAAAIRGE